MKIFLLLLMSLSLFANIGNIMAIKGHADIKREGSLLNAINGMVLEKGDNIFTAKKSRVQVMLKDETVITVGSNSSFSFMEYLYDETKKSKITMRANRGFFRSVTGRIGKLAPERFKVKTASATIGIRGTDFSGNIFGDREVFKCYRGIIFIEFDGKVYDVKAGMMAEIRKNKLILKSFNVIKAQKNLSKLDAIIVKAIDGEEIPTEVISDVTQVVNESELGNSQPATDTPPAAPFTITPGAEDRPAQF